MGSDQQHTPTRRWTLGVLAAFVALGTLGLWALIQALGPLDGRARPCERLGRDPLGGVVRLELRERFGRIAGRGFGKSAR